MSSPYVHQILSSIEILSFTEHTDLKYLKTLIPRYRTRINNDRDIYNIHPLLWLDYQHKLELLTFLEQKFNQWIIDLTIHNHPQITPSLHHPD